MSTTVEICSICEGSGLRVAMEDGRVVARKCECRANRRTTRVLEQARIPRRFRDCSLDNYEAALRSSHASVRKALATARHFVEVYPIETAGKGLMLVGSSGIGKTHLAVSLLRALVSERGATGVFWEQKQLLEAIRATYENRSAESENELLRSVTACDVLVLDDLGEMSPSDWSWDTTSHILNSRYNANLSTIITTNLENLPPLTPLANPNDTFAQAKRANSSATLGDRIGERMRSRLQEMCVVVEMHGEDFRQKVKRASFA